MKEFWKNFCDLLWVLQAFLRGKVLRQKAYRLQAGCTNLPVAVSVRRITKLMRWWGLRLATLEEIVALQRQQEKTFVPYIDWNGEELNLGWNEDSWDKWNSKDYPRFPIILK